MNFELEGNLIQTDDVVEISQSFKKREFVIEVLNERNADWNDYIKFQLTQDKCSIIEPFNTGDKIKVNFNIRGRKWEKDGKINYFSNLEAWRIEKADIGSEPGFEPPPFSENDIPPEAEGSDDLPF